MPILVFQHSDRGGPGRLGLTLRDHGLKLRVLRPDRGEPVPTDLDDVRGIVSLGGPQNVDEALAEPGRWPWMAREMDLLRRAHEAQLPVVGLCLGHQMIAAALGGEVTRMAEPEMGFLDVSLLPAGQTDTVHSGVAWAAPSFHTHGREVSKLPPGAVALASSARCKVQAFKSGLRTYGFQHHFECDRDQIGVYTREDGEMWARAGLSADEVTRQAERLYPAYARLADRLCLNITTYLFPNSLRTAAGRDMPAGSAAVSR